MAQQHDKVPPHVKFSKFGRLSIKGQTAVQRLMDAQEAAEERATGLEKIVLMAQLGPITVQSAGVHHKEEKGKELKMYQVYTVHTKQGADKSVEVHVRLCPHKK